MNKPRCLCGSDEHWVSMEIVDLSGKGPVSTGIFVYTCSCGTRVPHAIWHRAAERQLSAGLQHTTGQS